MKPPQTIDAALQAYFRDQASPDQLAALEHWLREDPAHVQLLVDLALLDGMMFNEQKTRDAAAVLTILLEAEENAHPDIVLLASPDDPPKPAKKRDNPITLREFCSVAGYLASETVHTKAFKIASVAAVLVLGAALYLAIFGGNATPPPQEMTEQTPARSEREQARPIEQTPLPEQARPVATLTATHNAQWAKPPAEGASAPGGSTAPAPAPGDPLHPGTRLTLTEGFAEITTHSGAVVTLEAPATIEMLESENALHLHEGKLVGICESESSKGFTVYTPTARITDLGTRFGAEVGKDKSTRTAVFDGEVELTARSVSPAEPSGSVRLTAGWSSGVSTRGVLDGEPQPLSARDHARFAHQIEDGMDPRFAYRRAVLSAEPLVYWGFDEANDRTRNLAGSDAFDGRAMGQTSYAKGLFGSALQLTGDIQSMGGFASMSPLDFNEVRAFTLEAWCWIDRPHYGRVVALAALDPDQTKPPMHLSMVEVIGGDLLSNIAEPHRDSVRFLHRNPPSFESVEGTNWFTEQAPPVGQWVHLVVVKDVQEARIYINGELAISANDTQPTATEYPLGLFVGVSPIMLRAELSTSPRDFRPFHGLIDEVAVYDTALTTQTIQHHFSLGRPSEGG